MRAERYAGLGLGIMGAVLTAASVAHAQFDPGASSVLQGQTNLSTQTYNRMTDAAVRAGQGSAGAPAPGLRTRNIGQVLLRQPGVKPGGAALATTYRAGPAGSARAKADYIAWARTISPREADQLARQLEPMDVPGVWSARIADPSYRAGDLVDAITAYIVVNWIMANRQAEAPDEAQAGTRRQVRAALAESGAIAGLTDMDRQVLAETLMINLIVQHSGYSNAWLARDKPLMNAISDAAQGRFKTEFGLDLRGLALTPDGLAAR
jgi:hypothetical protein